MAATTGPSDDDEKSTLEEMDAPEVSEKLQTSLNPIELQMYSDWRLDLLSWAFNKGKNPEFNKGHSKSAMRQHAYRIDRFFYWLFKEDGFTLSFNHEQANRYWTKVLKPNSNKLATNRKSADSISLIFKKNAYESDDEEESEKNSEWEIPKIESVYEQINSNKAEGFTDWFSVNEIEKIKHASLRAYAVPTRENMEPGEQDEWAAHLAQRLKKPKHQLSDDDWETANSYKLPSLVYVSCDVGFRPKEIERSRWGWFDLDQKVMRIKKSESTKNSDYWHCYLSEEATRLMRMWKQECYGDEEPDPNDAIWLTKENNPFSAGSLRKPNMQNLMDEAGIDRTERETGWYMIRRGVGTDIGIRMGLGALMSQLRIKRVETARRYVRHDERGVRAWIKSR